MLKLSQAADILAQSQPGCEHTGDDCELQKKTYALPPLTIMNSTVAAVKSFRFLGSTKSLDLKWDAHINSMVKKAKQNKFNLPQELLTQFFLTATRRLQWIVWTAGLRIFGPSLCTFQDL